ncbi:plasmid pRiA4b ORF-3 family protein [Tsukamurella paurometabola]|uniref:plasmid pRiA4b ORF-3 family protein n=1 Tax=Tsukamurella paurometabola TaxID=2061 RepID=UPI00019F03A3|nr:plasmid pRiA4b ORF-3 family protein [Tsukamurella paurometabola]
MVEDLSAVAREYVEGLSPQERRVVLDAVVNARFAAEVDALTRVRQPTLLPVPDRVVGFRVRLDLHGAKPPVWRRLELPGDLTLSAVHEVIQAAMGWYDCHLHKFRTGSDHRSPAFLTAFDVSEGEEGVLEQDVRLDQVIAGVGDELWYEYDFGDGWEHKLKVEQVLDTCPSASLCVAGKNACPPEDCGGLGGFHEVALWVRKGRDAAHLPDSFGSAEEANDWLPGGWDPDVFDVDDANAAITLALFDPASVLAPGHGELGQIAHRLTMQGSSLLQGVLARPQSHGQASVSAAEAERLTEPYRLLLEEVGEGVKLTAAGYLPPVVVERFAQRSGIANWWMGKANREDLTPPVATVREAAQAVGLLSVRKGRISPTRAARRIGGDPTALWEHIVGRLPCGTKDFDREAGWLLLAVVGSGTPVENWRKEVSDLLYAAGWRTGGANRYPMMLPVTSPTYTILESMTDTHRDRWHVRGTDDGIAATARAVLNQR